MSVRAFELNEMMIVLCPERGASSLFPVHVLPALLPQQGPSLQTLQERL